MDTPQGLEGRIGRATAALGAPQTPEAAAALGAWIALISAWNARVDLTAARSDDELVDLMLADALILAPRLPAAARVVDVGSGAGAPGLPLAIARPDLRVTLVEPLQKRVAFLRTVSGSWGSGPLGTAAGDPQRSPPIASGASPPATPRPAVVRGRGEDLVRRGELFDVAVSRATLAPDRWLALGAELAPAGEVWVLLARDEPPARAGWAVADDLRYRWPLTGAERRAVRFVQRESAK